MIDYLYSSILWVILIGLDFLVARRLFFMYRKDRDLRKLMFAIGLATCTPVYFLAFAGIDSFPFSRSIFDWSPLPILLAFVFTLLNERLNLSLKNCFWLFLGGTALTFGLFFLPLPNLSTPFLIAGLIFAIFLGILQYSRKFDLASVTLFLSMPSFAVCFTAIGVNMTELALLAGFAAKAALLIAFDVSKNQLGDSSSILVLKEKLDTAEDNFGKLFCMLPDPAAIVDNIGTILAITPIVTALSGFKKEEIVGTNFLETGLFSAGVKALMIKNLAKRMLGFQISPYKVEVQSKDGIKKMQFEVNASKIEYEGKAAALVVFRDLTERNKLIKEVEQEQERFQTIAESTGDWVWEVDSEGRYVYSNPVVERILGYTGEEIISKSFFDLLAPNDNIQMGEFSEVFAGKISKVGMIKRCLRKDGHVAIMETHGLPIYGVGGKIVGYRGVDRDITEKQEMEERLLKSERLAAIGELATMVAHDLRNPLQAVSAAAYYVKKATKQLGNEQVASMLQRIEDSVKYSEKIVRDLLDFSANIKLELSETDPHSIVNQALSRLILPANIEVVDRTQNKPKSRLDVDRISRVIVNLVTNAFDAMPDGGKLTVVSKEVNGSLELSFADTGSGIPKEKMERLWTPFVTTKAKGMGLGLPISKRIVESHGGQIIVDSENGKGTMFTVVIPIKASGKTNAEFYINEDETNFLKATYSLRQERQQG